MPRWSRIAVLVVGLAVLLGNHYAIAEESRSPKLESARPFLASYCGACHGADEPEGNIVLSSLDLTKIGDANNPTLSSGRSPKNAKVWAQVLEVLLTGKMPPPGEEQPSADQRKQVTASIRRALLKAGHELEIDHKLRQPAYANLLNHQKLFDGSESGPAYSRPRMWRLHPQGYDLFLSSFGRELNAGGPLSKPFMVGEDKGLVSNYAALMQADSATLGQLILNCRQIAQLQTVGFKRMEKDRRTKEMVERTFRRAPDSFTAIVDSDQPATDEQIAAAVVEEFQIVLSRAPTDDEQTRFAALLKQAVEIGGKQRGLRTMAMAVLLRPESIYRMEVGLGDKDESGRRRLSSYELAYAIAYALTDTSPRHLNLGPPKPRDRSRRAQPPTLMDLAEQGKLQTRDDVRKVVELIWDQDNIDKPRILRFFQEFFGYHAAQTVFKGDRATRSFATKFLVGDADRLVMHIVDNDRHVLKELLTTQRYFVQWPGSLEDYEKRITYITTREKNKKSPNHKYFIERSAAGLHPIPQANPTWRQTVRFYNLDEKTWDYPLEQPFAMPVGERVGLLTHPAWLVAWSGNFENDPIRRGKWIREHLLAGSVPDVPITVDASIPEDPHKTLRQRLRKTRDDYCWQCHRKMDPLGLPFEAYNDFGRFRTVEALGPTKALAKPKRTAAVETSGEIVGSGDPAIDGPVEDVHQLMHRLADSERVRQSFVRHAFRYWMGRNESMTDSPTLLAADRAYVDGEGSFRALVISLLTSDSFLSRK